jgi:EAL domain-containing protein (putative c-di-GMP-specific phosphodiesterase class I)
LSRRQLAWNGLADRLRDHLRAADLAPGRFEIEISEDLLLADADAGGLGLAALKNLGMRIALDDFGRGPMSLRGLQLGVLNTIKLAREIHHDLVEDRQHGAVVRALVALAKDLGLRVVAEGVDRHEQLTFLRRSGCDAVQAFMNCPPLPPDACTSWLRRPPRAVVRSPRQRQCVGSGRRAPAA